MGGRGREDGRAPAEAATFADSELEELEADTLQRAMLVLVLSDSDPEDDELEEELGLPEGPK